MMRYDAFQMAQHARSLSRAFHVRLIEDTGLARHEAMAIPVDRLPPSKRGALADWSGAVLCHPIEDETGYAVALHEIGHVLAPLGSLVHERMRASSAVEEHTLKLMQEEAAWEWAEHYALDWTTAMEQVKQFGLSSYHAGLLEAQAEAQASRTPRPVDPQTAVRAAAIADCLARQRRVS